MPGKDFRTTNRVWVEASKASKAFRQDTCWKHWTWSAGGSSFRILLMSSNLVCVGNSAFPDSDGRGATCTYSDTQHVNSHSNISAISKCQCSTFYSDNSAHMDSLTSEMTGLLTDQPGLWSLRTCSRTLCLWTLCLWTLWTLWNVSTQCVCIWTPPVYRAHSRSHVTVPRSARQPPSAGECACDRVITLSGRKSCWRGWYWYIMICVPCELNQLTSDVDAVQRCTRALCTARVYRNQLWVSEQASTGHV